MSAKQTVTRVAGVVLGAALNLTPLLAAGPGVLKFDEDSYAAGEGSTVQVVVERSQGENGAASVRVISNGGSASPGNDYAAVDVLLEWANGDGTNRSVPVALTADGVAEGSETIELALVDASGAAIDPTRDHSTIRITDGGGAPGDDTPGDDGPGVLKFDEDSYSASEGSTVQVVVERSQGESGAASVRVISNGGTASPGSDYAAVDVLLEWASGDGTNRSVPVALVADGVAEGSETIQLALVDASGAAIDSTRDHSTIRISDGGGAPGDDPPGDDGAGVFKFDERTYFATESARKAVITVERSHGESGAVTVSYAANAGTATAGDDFQEVTGTLSWPSGDESLRSFEVPINNDDLAEPNETVELLLFSPTGGATLSDTRSTATLLIMSNGGDNPGAPGTISFDETSFEVIEGQAQAIVRVERSGGESGAVSVSYSTSDGSATDGLDYAGVSGTLSWGAGDGTDKTFAIPIFDDGDDEGNETISLHLSSPTGGAALGAASSLVNILDDDGSGLPCEPGDDSGCVSGDRFAFEVIYRTGNGLTGRGHVVPLSESSAMVWFFNANNVEMLIKVLDACSFQAKPAFWVFFSATTNVDYTVRVTDTHTGVTQDYRNLLGQPAQPVLDTTTFQTCSQ